MEHHSDYWGGEPRFHRSAETWEGRRVERLIRDLPRGLKCLVHLRRKEPRAVIRHPHSTPEQVFSAGHHDASPR